MFCRVCGAEINDAAEICVKCGCRPLNGTEYCQVCGAKTTSQQELCVKCGCRLGKQSISQSSSSRVNTGHFLDSVNDLFGKGTNNNEKLILDFSSLDPYYQREFQRIYDSGETYKGKFNIWAFLFGVIWALTKGAWLSAIVCLVLSTITFGVVGIVYWFIYGIRGTYMYYCSYVKDKQNIV